MPDRPATRPPAGWRRPRAPRSRRVAPVFLAACLLAPAFLFAAVPTHDTYYSPRNKSRAVRGSTRYIILHTTEGPAKGSGQKLSRNGEAHYMIDEAGRIYRIIDRRRIAYHCGRSMWDGRTDLDRCSIGIEMVGRHDKKLTYKQKVSLANLLKELKRIYGIPDYRVLTHSMVAYGAPNQWHKRPHRGRKRCGMLMATSSERISFGVKSRPSYDPDVRAGRLAVADKELQRVLYSGPSAAEEKAVVASFEAKDAGDVVTSRRSAWDIARDAYRSSTTTYVFPNGKTRRGNEITNWKAIPAGTRVVLGRDARENEEKGASETDARARAAGNDATAARPGKDAAARGGDGRKTLVKATPGAVAAPPAANAAAAVAAKIAGDGWDAADTFYVTPDGKSLRGSELTAATLALVVPGVTVLKGYRAGGPVAPRLPAFGICGAAWNRRDTYYLTPGGKLLAGDKISATRIPAGTVVFYRK